MNKVSDGNLHKSLTQIHKNLETFDSTLEAQIRDAKGGKG